MWYGKDGIECRGPECTICDFLHFWALLRSLGHVAEDEDHGLIGGFQGVLEQGRMLRHVEDIDIAQRPTHYSDMTMVCRASHIDIDFLKFSLTLRISGCPCSTRMAKAAT
jgi:hypothetical protein